MSNAYIIDAFLSFWLWFALIGLYISISKNIKNLNHMMSKNLFEHAVESLAKRSLIFSAPFLAVLLFLLYRFSSLLYQTDMGGAGAIGLIVIMTICGMVMIWLKILLTLITHSDYAKASRRLNELKNPSNTKPAKPN